MTGRCGCQLSQCVTCYRDALRDDMRARRMAKTADHYAAGLLTWGEAAERMEAIALGVA